MSMLVYRNIVDLHIEEDEQTNLCRIIITFWILFKWAGVVAQKFKDISPGCCREVDEATMT